jgi:hypothetical protein
MAQIIIENFTYKDDSKKLGIFIRDNYPGVFLKFNLEKKELIIISKDEYKLKVVKNILYAINRFDLKF